MGRRGTKDDRLLVALVSGETVEKAAELAGLSRSAAYRRLGDRSFIQRLNEARSAAFQNALSRLSSNVMSAADKLVALMEGESESTQRLAAMGLLQIVSRLRESVELESRLLAVEGFVNEQKEASGRR